MTRADSIRFLLYGLAALVAAATFFWASSSLSTISFAWPQNPGWRNGLNILLVCLLPSMFGLVFIGKSLVATQKGKFGIGFALLAIPVVATSLLLFAVYIYAVHWRGNF